MAEQKQKESNTGLIVLILTVISIIVGALLAFFKQKIDAEKAQAEQAPAVGTMPQAQPVAQQQTVQPPRLYTEDEVKHLLSALTEKGDNVVNEGGRQLLSAASGRASEGASQPIIGELKPTTRVP